MTDAKPVAELRREAQARRREWSGKMFEVYGRPLDKHVREVREAEVATEAAIDSLADRAEAAESDLQRTTQLWKRALEDLKAAESRIANEVAARHRAQEHGIGDRARIEELERERDALQVALNNVSGALVDSGVPVPDESYYGRAVREIMRERDEARQLHDEHCGAGTFFGTQPSPCTPPWRYRCSSC